MKRVLFGLALAMLALFVACAFWNRLAPERWAVNAPLGGFLGRSVGAPPDSAFGSRIQVPAGFQIGFDQADGRVLVDGIGAHVAPVGGNGHVLVLFVVETFAPSAVARQVRWQGGFGDETALPTMSRNAIDP